MHQYRRLYLICNHHITAYATIYYMHAETLYISDKKAHILNKTRPSTFKCAWSSLEAFLHENLNEQCGTPYDKMLSCMPLSTCIYIYVCVHVRMHVCIHASMHICIYAYVRRHVYLYIYIYTYTCVCISTYTSSAGVMTQMATIVHCLACLAPIIICQSR